MKNILLTKTKSTFSKLKAPCWFTGIVMSLCAIFILMTVNSVYSPDENQNISWLAFICMIFGPVFIMAFIDSQNDDVYIIGEFYLFLPIVMFFVSIFIVHIDSHSYKETIVEKQAFEFGYIDIDAEVKYTADIFDYASVSDEKMYHVSSIDFNKLQIVAEDRCNIALVDTNHKAADDIILIGNVDSANFPKNVDYAIVSCGDKGSVKVERPTFYLEYN